MALFLPQRWRRQPAAVSQINDGHPFGQRVLFAWVASSGLRDLRGVLALSMGTGATLSASVAGAAFIRADPAANTTTALIASSGNPTHLQVGAVTYLAFARTYSNAGNSAGLIARGMGSANPSIGLLMHRGSLDGVKMAFNGVTTDFSNDPTDPTAAVPEAELERPALCVLTYNGSNQGRTYINGRALTTADLSGIGALDYSRTDEPLRIGAGFFNSEFSGEIYAAMVLRGAMTPSEVAALNADTVWSLLKPQSNPIISLPSFLYSRPAADVSNTGWVRVG